MPELPDVEVYVAALRRFVVGRNLQVVRIQSPFLVRSVTPRIEEAQGRAVLSVTRMGKRIVLGLEGNLFLILHLMIAGRLRWKARGTAVPRKWGLAAFDFEHGTLLLTEAGSKRRASLHLVLGEDAVREQDPGGLEILQSTFEAFDRVLHSESHTLKRVLTDPHLFSGIGNAYSDEILHAARLSPLQRTAQLDQEQSRRLFEACRETLTIWTRRLMEEVGDGFPDKVTAFREGMAVHGRYRQPCPVCAAPVQRIVHAENECNYCPVCQTDGKLLADRALSRLLRQDWPKTWEDLELRRAGKKPGPRPQGDHG
ncbi:MAG: DNA-formamidopyrimidine glycosylase family protein [Acidobacteriota bacterium]